MHTANPHPSPQANDPFFMIGSKHIESETQIHRERDGMWVYDVPR